MAKKKKNRKQRKLQRQQTASVAARPAQLQSSNPGPSTASTTKKAAIVKTTSVTKPAQPTVDPAAQSQEFHYVGRELRHSLLIVAGILLAYIVIWVVLTHTGLGAALTTWLHW